MPKKVTFNYGSVKRRLPMAWREAALFGALWGACEMTLGAFIHTTRIPLAGVLIASVGAIILIAGQLILRRDWFPLRAALVCAGLRSFAPGGVIFGPLFAIVLQGLIASLAFMALRYTLAAAVTTGFLAAFTSLAQGLLVKLVFYGGTLWDIYMSLLRKGESLFGLQTGQGWLVVGLFVITICSVGVVAGIIGWRVGTLARRREAAGHE